MRIDRGMQPGVLNACADIYPKWADPTRVMEVCEISDQAVFAGNVAYLVEHELLRGSFNTYQDAATGLGNCMITVKGLDFLAEDGGLSAIPGVVTVKLHADTIRDMLIAKYEASTLPGLAKSALRKQIEALPAAALQTLTTRSAQEGLAHMPDLWHWIRAATGM